MAFSTRVKVQLESILIILEMVARGVNRRLREQQWSCTECP